MCVWDQQRRWVLEYVEPAECEQMGPAGSVLPEICLTRVHNEIHDIRKLRKPCLVKYFKWLLKVMGWQRARFVFRPDHRGHFGSPKGLVEGGLARTS